MRIFLLEDSMDRIIAIQDATLGRHHDLTVASWLNGSGGAYRKFQPPYDLLLLDHDLGGAIYVNSDEEETGFQFCRWLGPAPKVQPSVIIHSWNPEGAKAMNVLLTANGWEHVYRQPYGVTLLTFLKGDVHAIGNNSNSGVGSHPANRCICAVPGETDCCPICNPGGSDPGPDPARS